ncbi:MAG TPA: CTP synthase, partial [Ignisphaera sp.]|nr:CTP synthase [Ignisphaera sp.]
LFVHVALVPTLKTTGEQKTKPVQHSVQELRRIGIQPDIIIARSEKPLEKEAKRKIALYSNVPSEAVISDYDVETIYEVPLLLYEQGVHRLIASRLQLDYREPDLSKWIDFVVKLKNSSKRVRIAMVGKYTKLRDSYISIVEALRHGSAYLGVKPELVWIESTDIERNSVKIEEYLEDIHGAIVLPGFGRRGTEGKIAMIKYFRENNIPVLGICFGFQLMVVEFARNVLGLDKANSTELDPHTPHPVVDLLPSQQGITMLGGTMRLGAKPIKLLRGSKVYEAYQRDVVFERHRHRYGVNPKYLDKFEEAGFTVSGFSYDGVIEFMELREHPFFVGTQAHPEFKSRPLDPSPIYMHFLKYVLNRISHK